MGFFTGLSTEAYDRSYRDRDLIRRMVRYFLSYRRQLSISILGMICIASAGAATPILISRGMDLMVASGKLQISYTLASILFAVGILIWAANWIRRRLIARAVADVMLDLRGDAFTAAIGHDLSFYDKFSSGRVVSRITSDTQEFAQVVVLITDLVTQIFQAIVLLVYLIAVNTHLTLWLVAFMPIVFSLAIAFRRLARYVTRRGFRAMANVNAAIKEAVTGIAVAKNFRQEANIFKEFEEINATSYNANVRRGFILAIIFPSLDMLAGAATALLVYIGATSTVQGVITYGSWYLFLSSLNRFWFPMLYLSAFWTQLQNGLSAAERVFALIDAEPAVIQNDSLAVPPLRGEIIFEDLSFFYVTGEPVLENFNLHIRPGENLALVGHTGAGKSSLAKLITRFYEFQGGRLLIDGIDLRSLDLPLYRRQLGIVSQDPFLFSGTVADNICYTGPNINSAEIEIIARQIGDGDWLETLPDGLLTEVGERGKNLSMGQRQLISLMRVLVQRPTIFILDEATASVDPFTEAQIQEALSLILAESTSIVIAHRLSTVKAADRIIVLKDGAIIEEGTHKSLMAQTGHYAELYNTYFRHQTLAYIEQARTAALDE